MKITEKAVFKEAKEHNVNYLTQTTARIGNVSLTFSYVNAVFEKEDNTLLVLSTSKRKASKLMKGRVGLLTHRGGKLISFKDI